MKYNCDIIKDLLPSYTDNICSEASRKVVEEHFKECASCRKLAGEFNDNNVENVLNNEKENVLSKHNKRMVRKTYTIGIITALVLMVPVIICLICNLAIGHALDWFFIVLASMLLTGSLTVVPLVAETRKFMWTVIYSTASLIFLLAVCNVYTHGEWFFVAVSSCIFGISLICAPFVLKQMFMTDKIGSGEAGNKNIGSHTALICMAWDSFWLYAILVTTGIFTGGNKEYWQIALSISTYILIIVWVCFIVIRYGKCNRLIKAGIITIIISIATGTVNDVLNIFMPEPSGSSLKHVTLIGLSTAGVNEYDVFNSNLCFLIMVIGVIVGATLIVVGNNRKKMN